MNSKFGWTCLLIALLLNSCIPATQPIASASPEAAASLPGVVHKLGDTTVSSQDGMTLIYIPAGEFVMGTDTGMTDEAPAHKVYLDAYWLDQTEVTNEAYRKCVDFGACQPPAATVYYDDPDYASHPVEYVSWRDAVAYCTFAGRRLPTEAEWEKAATWNPNTNEKYVYPWGNTYDCSKGNYDDETEQDASLMPDGSVNCDGFARSAPVGSFPQGASPYGVLDMGGNVWEWVHDAFLETDPLLYPEFKNYYAISPYENPQGVDPAGTAYRVMRGGSWNYTFGAGRAVYRLWYGMDDAHDGVGFRCAMSEATEQ